MKHDSRSGGPVDHVGAFSILKRIVMGETRRENARTSKKYKTFSILKRIVMGETCAMSA